VRREVREAIAVHLDQPLEARFGDVARPRRAAEAPVQELEEYFVRHDTERDAQGLG